MALNALCVSGYRDAKLVSNSPILGELAARPMWSVMQRGSNIRLK